MFPLIKQHFLINSLISYLMIAGLITGAYLVAIPPTFLFIITILSLAIILFFYDDKNNVNQFMISLPIAKKTMIQSRYLYIALMSVVILLFQWLIMLSFPSPPEFFRYIYDWRDMIVLLSIAYLSTAICIPIYYALRSFALATGIIAILWCLGSFFMIFPIVSALGMDDMIIFNDMDAGFVLLVEKYIPIQPYAVLIIVSLLLFYISMKISEQLLRKKDY